MGSYAEEAEIAGNSSKLSLETDNVEINMLDIIPQSATLPLHFRELNKNGSVNSSTGDTSNISFSIPMSVLHNAKRNVSDSLRVTFLLYKNSALYKESTSAQRPLATVINNETVEVPDSPVIVATVKDVDTRSLAEPVTFQIRKPTPGLRYKCVYWNEAGRIRTESRCRSFDKWARLTMR